MDRHIDEHGTEGVAPHHLEEWMAYHPSRDDISAHFEQHLRAQGHDGIVYGNEHEGPIGHQCAIAFHDTPVTMHRWEWMHPDQQHLNLQSHQEHYSQPGKAGTARRGMARLGSAWLGWAWRARTRTGVRRIARQTLMTMSAPPCISSIG
jgi:hypothetical protein